MLLLSINMEFPHLSSIFDSIISLVHFGTISIIYNVIVDSNIVKEKGRFTTIDLTEASKSDYERIIS